MDRLPKTVLYRMQKSSGGRAELECRQELMQNPTDPDDFFYTIKLAVADKHRSFSNRISDEEIAELIDRSKYVVNDQSTDIWDAHQFLSEYICDTSQSAAADMIYNLISSNPIPYIEDLYHQLNTYYTSPKDCNILIDEEDALLFDFAGFTCKYMRQLSYICGCNYKLSDPIIVFQSFNTASEKNGRGHADLCWTDTVLTIMYRPYVKDDIPAAEPWKISIKERKTHTGQKSSSEPPKERIIEKRVSFEEYVNLIDSISNAFDHYRSCTD